MKLAIPVRRGTLRKDAVAGVVLGVESVPDGLAAGLLANLTGYKAEGANRVARAANTLIHPGELHWQSLLTGVLTIALILLLERTNRHPITIVMATRDAEARSADSTERIAVDLSSS